MNASDLNSQILYGVGQGVNAAVNRFAERMAAIRERNSEQKLSKFWENYTFGLAKEVDDLTAQLRLKALQVNDRTRELAAVKHFHADAEKAVVARDKYMADLAKRLHEVEEQLQQETARVVALEEFRKVVVAEMEDGVPLQPSTSLDAEKGAELIAAARQRFLVTTCVKKGLPAGYPPFRPAFRT